MSTVLVYYTASTDYQFKTEPMLVHSEHGSSPVEIALLCEVPTGISEAFLVDMNLDYEGEFPKGTARVKYRYEGDERLSHLIEYKLDCTRTKLHLRKKK